MPHTPGWQSDPILAGWPTDWVDKLTVDKSTLCYKVDLLTVDQSPVDEMT